MKNVLHILKAHRCQRYREDVTQEKSPSLNIKKHRRHPSQSLRHQPETRLIKVKASPVTRGLTFAEHREKLHLPSNQSSVESAVGAGAVCAGSKIRTTMEGDDELSEER